MKPVDELHLHRLLVAVDGSRASELALSAAVTAARRDNAAVTLICVAPDVIADASRFAWTAAGTPPCDQPAADEATDRILREAADAVPEDIPVRRVLRRGKAGPEIVAQAASEPYDAIIMGARGVGRVGALMGSVSSYVMAHADVAVFVAHAPREAPPVEPSGTPAP